LMRAPSALSAKRSIRWCAPKSGPKTSFSTVSTCSRVAKPRFPPCAR
jgi:hypothetical protein